MTPTSNGGLEMHPEFVLLHKDYWASFDLVLADLSKTIMPLSVTSELDMFDALGL
jgi:hypothetical protein